MVAAPDPRQQLAAAAGDDGVAELEFGGWLVTDPAATEGLLASRHTHTVRADLRTSVTSWGPDGLAAWMAARRAMRPALTAASVSRFVPVLTESATAAVARWPVSGTIDGMREAVRLVAAINTRYVIGDPPEPVSSLIATELDVAEKAANARLSSWFRHRQLLRTQRRTYTAILDHVRAYRANTDQRNVLDVLIDTGVDERTVVLAIRSMLLSGHRVPAAALAWILHEISAHSGAQDEARREAVEYLARSPDDRNATTDLTYCQAVVRETLRLHPPIWQFQRRLAAPATACGREFPAGSTLTFSTHVNQRDRRLYAEPDEFRPERWLPADFRPRPGSYFPFGSGPRVCPGSALALTELTVLLAVVLAAHHVAPDRPPRASRGVLDAPDGLRLRVAPTGATPGVVPS